MPRGSCARGGGLLAGGPHPVPRAAQVHCHCQVAAGQGPGRGWARRRRGRDAGTRNRQESVEIRKGERLVLDEILRARSRRSGLAVAAAGRAEKTVSPRRHRPAAGPPQADRNKSGMHLILGVASFGRTAPVAMRHPWALLALLGGAARGAAGSRSSRSSHGSQEPARRTDPCPALLFPGWSRASRPPARRWPGPAELRNVPRRVSPSRRWRRSSGRDT